MKALQDAVPEDVREKLTTAVSGILHAKGTQLKINELLDISRIPSVSSGLKSKSEEKFKGTSNVEGLLQDHHSSDNKKADSLLDGTVNNQPGMQKPLGGVESELFQSDRSQKSVNSDQSQSMSSDGDNNSGSVRKEVIDSGNNDNYDDSLKGKGLLNSENIEKGLETGPKADSSENVEKGLETGPKASSSCHAEKASAAEEANFEEQKDQNLKTALSDTKEDINAKNEEKSVPDQNKMTTPGAGGESGSPSGPSSEAHSMEKEESGFQKKDNKLALDQAKSNLEFNSPAFSVSGALDALTGMDDSTQVAVNSIFGVIENMISQLEEDSDNEDEAKDEKNDSGLGSVSANDNADNNESQNSEATPVDQSVQPEGISDSAVFKHCENGMDLQADAPNESIEKESTQRPISFNGIDMKVLQDRDTANRAGKDGNTKKDQLAGSNLLLGGSDRLRKVENIPAPMTSNTFGSSYYNENSHKYILSEMPTKSLDSDATTALLLEYFPEEGQWKLLEQPGSNGAPIDDVENEVHKSSPAKADDRDEVIEPLYVILDTEKQQEPVEEFETMDHKKEKVEIDDNTSEELRKFVKNIILDALKVEVGRRLGADSMNEIEPNLARYLDQVANAVAISVRHDVKHALFSDVKYHSIDGILEKVDALNGEHIIRTISSAVQETSYLRKVLPVGVIVGSSLAALRKIFNVTTEEDDDTLDFEAKNLGEKDLGKVKVAATQKMPSEKSVQNSRLDGLDRKKGGKYELNSNKNATVMVGAVTAALGASALLVQQQVTVNLYISCHILAI